MVCNLDFYSGKRVLVTGHTGFKGTWLCRMLVNSGAIVTGYSLEAPTNPNLYSLSGINNRMTSIIGDIRDFSHLEEVLVITDLKKDYSAQIPHRSVSMYNMFLYCKPGGCGVFERVYRYA